MVVVSKGDVLLVGGCSVSVVVVVVGEGVDILVVIGGLLVGELVCVGVRFSVLRIV